LPKKSRDLRGKKVRTNEKKRREETKEKKEVRTKLKNEKKESKGHKDKNPPLELLNAS
jgi:hypothetical protein